MNMRCMISAVVLPFNQNALLAGFHFDAPCVRSSFRAINIFVQDTWLYEQMQQHISCVVFLLTVWFGSVCLRCAIRLHDDAFRLVVPALIVAASEWRQAAPCRIRLRPALCLFDRAADDACSWCRACGNSSLLYKHVRRFVCTVGIRVPVWKGFSVFMTVLSATNWCHTYIYIYIYTCMYVWLILTEWMNRSNVVVSFTYLNAP
jgi:hypothetical protein